MSDSNRSGETRDSIGYISLIAIAGIALIVGGLSYLGGRYVNEREDRSEYNYTKAHKNATQACIGREGMASTECVTKEVEAERSHHTATDDLKAQQEMAEWAFWMVVVSFGSMVLTGFGVFFIKYTLEATKDAVEETKKATKAMERSNQIAKRAATDNRFRQMRDRIK